MQLHSLSSNSNSLETDPVCCACHFINEEHNSKHGRLPHSHNDFLELLFIYKGSGKYIVDTTTYTVSEGDIVICNAGTLHGESPDGTRHVRSYSIGVKNLKLKKLPENQICDKDIVPVVSCGVITSNVKEIFQLIYRLTDGGTKQNDICDSLAKSLILLTKQLIDERGNLEVSKSVSSAHATAERIRFYLNEHSHEALSLSEIADALNLNKYYLAHTFKSEYGISPIQYTMERRIGEAQGYLMDSTLPIGDIADMLGFSSTAHFNSMFSKYVGIPPGKYRDSFKNMEE
ncbi:MAG: AraC family transcriptional regulator [Candidatus Alectryocaccobium sp.]